MARVMEKSALAEVSNAGEFKRTSSVFRDFITQEEGTNTFAAEAGRYHLYVSLACPWAHRCLMVLSMKGLWSSSSLTETAPVVGVSVVHPTWARTRESDENDLHRGWQFVDPSVTDYVTSVNGCGRFSTAGCTPDAVHGVQFVRDLYNLADPSDSQGKYTVPILWDTKRNTIVNNESSEILRMLNDQFNAFATTPTLDLYPAPLRTEIDQINQWTYEINNGVYKCGFATSQQAYDQAEAHLYAMLDKAEELLGTRRYLCGDALTECDVRLFPTLIRFDAVYVVYFKCSRKALREFPNLFNFTKDVYQQPGVAQTVDLQHITTHYFSSHETLNRYAIIPRAPDIDYSSAHDRDRF